MVDYIDDFESYLKEKKNASYNTVVSYVRDVRSFKNFVYEKKLTDIKKSTDEDVGNYIRYLQEIGKSDSTITRSIASLKSFFSYLLSKKIIQLNPTRSIKPLKKKKNIPRILTSEEVNIFLSQPKNDSLKGCRDKAMLELLYATGIRVSELISLDTDDLNTEIGFIRCQKAGGTERIIPLYPVAVSAVADYIKTSRPLLVSSAEENALFVNVNGKRMTRQGFWKIIKFYQEKAKITTEITPHVLRHSFAVHLLENGADIGSIKEVMGHSDISSTNVYAQLIKDKLMTSYMKFHPRA